METERSTFMYGRFFELRRTAGVHALVRTDNAFARTDTDVQFPAKRAREQQPDAREQYGGQGRCVEQEEEGARQG